MYINILLRRNVYIFFHKYRKQMAFGANQAMHPTSRRWAMSEQVRTQLIWGVEIHVGMIWLSLCRADFSRMTFHCYCLVSWLNH